MDGGLQRLHEKLPFEFRGHQFGQGLRILLDESGRQRAERNLAEDVAVMLDLLKQFTIALREREILIFFRR